MIHDGVITLCQRKLLIVFFGIHEPETPCTRKAEYPVVFDDVEFVLCDECHDAIQMEMKVA